MLAVGERFGRYEVRQVLGAGGMGEVLLAHDTMLQRLVALKIVRRDVERPDAVARLLAEARAAAALKHPNVVTLLDAGEIDGVSYLAMEYVEGTTLRAYVGAGGEVGSKLDWLQKIASALAAAHAAGIVHRDIKPENVIVGADQTTLKVLDFGIAKRIVTTETPTTGGGPMSVRTVEGRVIGTTAYMAPEQLAGGAPSPKWDQFAWGMTAYELLSGMRPTAEHVTVLSTFVPGVPFEVASTIARAMMPNAEQRYASMEDVARALGATTGNIRRVEVTPHAGKPIATTAPLHVSTPPTLVGRRASRVLVALLAFIVGAAIVVSLYTRRPKAIATTVTASTAASSPPPVSTVASATASVAPPPEAPPSASATHAVIAAAAFQRGCLCMPLSMPHLSLCSKDQLGPARCKCQGDQGGTLCPVPWTSDGTCPNFAFTMSAAARDGDVCEGYSSETDLQGNVRNTRYQGKADMCRPCTEPRTFGGMEGDRCVGYRNERVPVEGAVDCTPLQYGCRDGDAVACSELKIRRKNPP
jgi:serine/threonine protein kinase